MRFLLADAYVGKIRKTQVVADLLACSISKEVLISLALSLGRSPCGQQFWAVCFNFKIPYSLDIHQTLHKKRKFSAINIAEIP